MAGLFALAALSPVLPRRAVPLGTLALAGAGLAAAFAALLTGQSAALALPVGLPGAGSRLALDALSAALLLPVLVSAAASAASVAWAPEESGPTAPLLPLFVGCMALTLLAGDGFTLVLGFEGMSLASWGLVLANHRDDGARPAALLYLGMAVFGGACLIPAMALLAPAAGPFLEQGALDLSFAAVRAAPPEGWKGTAVLALALLGAGSKAGLAPGHLWLPLAHPAAPSHVSALMSGGMTKVALYVLIRVLFDLCGPATPVWWGVPLLVMGAVSAVLGALRANAEADLKAVLAASTVENVGLIAVGLGAALLARGADLTSLAALALGGALLHALAHGTFKTLLFLVAGAVQHGAGTRRLSHLGGLIHRMPVTAAAALVGGASLAALPLSAGFAGEWVLFQGVLAAPRVGGLALQTGLAVTAASMALAAALAAAAAVRLIGVAFLGRPRTAAAAAALEAPRHVRAVLAGLAALSVALGLLPGPALRLLDPAVRAMLGADLDGAGLLAVATEAAVPGYAAPGLALLLALCGGAIVWAVRARTVPGARRAPAWDCGFGASSAEGSPATQYGAGSMAQPLMRAFGGPVLDAREATETPPPGDTGPARHAATRRDPAEPFLHAPVLRMRERLSGAADQLGFMTVRQALNVVLAGLVGLLALVAALRAA